MRNLILVLALVGSTVWMSCGGSAPESETSDVSSVELEDEAWQEMMEVHDEVMPEMAEMNRVSRELKAFEADLSDKARKEKINKVVKDLEAASEGMMAWMGELQQPKKLRAGKSHEEIMAYFKAETEEITQVKEDMLSSLAQGQALLKELEAETTAE